MEVSLLHGACENVHINVVNTMYSVLTPHDCKLLGCHGRLSYAAQKCPPSVLKRIVTSM